MTKDRTQEFTSFLALLNPLPLQRTYISPSEFTQKAANVSKGITATSQLLEELVRVVGDKNPFGKGEEEMGRLSGRIKEKYVVSHPLIISLLTIYPYHS